MISLLKIIITIILFGTGILSGRTPFPDAKIDKKEIVRNFSELKKKIEENKDIQSNNDWNPGSGFSLSDKDTSEDYGNYNNNGSDSHTYPDTSETTFTSIDPESGVTTTTEVTSEKTTDQTTVTDDKTTETTVTTEDPTTTDPILKEGWRFEIITAEESIKYETETIYDPNLPEGFKEVRQAGIKGNGLVTYRQYYDESGSPREKIVVSITVLTPPVNEIIAIGTKTSNISNNGKYLEDLAGAVDDFNTIMSEGSYDMPKDAK